MKVIPETRRAHQIWYLRFINNIPFISRRSVLLVEETGVPGDKHRHIAIHQLLCQLNLYWVYISTNWSQTHHDCNGDTHS